MNECIFCKIVMGELPSEIIYKDEDIVAFKDIHPRAPIHILIVPKKHIESLANVSEKDASSIPHLFLVARKIAEELGIKDKGFRTIFNVGPDAGMMVDHLHLHLLGGRRLGSMG